MVQTKYHSHLLAFMTSKPELIEILKTIPWFVDLTPKQRIDLANISTLTTYEAGQSIFCEGDRADNLYVILSGEVEVTIAVPGRGVVKIFNAEPLDVIGWATLTPIVRQRTASVYTLKKTQLLLMPGGPLDELCEKDHHLGYLIMKRVANVTASNVVMVKLHLMEQILQETHS